MLFLGKSNEFFSVTRFTSYLSVVLCFGLCLSLLAMHGYSFYLLSAEVTFQDQENVLIEQDVRSDLKGVVFPHAASSSAFTDIMKGNATETLKNVIVRPLEGSANSALGSYVDDGEWGEINPAVLNDTFENPNSCSSGSDCIGGWDDTGSSNPQVGDYCAMVAPQTVFFSRDNGEISGVADLADLGLKCCSSVVRLVGDSCQEDPFFHTCIGWNMSGRLADRHAARFSYVENGETIYKNLYVATRTHDGDRRWCTVVTDEETGLIDCMSTAKYGNMRQGGGNPRPPYDSCGVRWKYHEMRTALCENSDLMGYGTCELDMGAANQSSFIRSLGDGSNSFRMYDVDTGEYMRMGDDVDIMTERCRKLFNGNLSRCRWN